MPPNRHSIAAWRLHDYAGNPLGRYFHINAVLGNFVRTIMFYARGCANLIPIFKNNLKPCARLGRGRSGSPAGRGRSMIRYIPHRYGARDVVPPIVRVRGIPQIGVPPVAFRAHIHH